MERIFYVAIYLFCLGTLAPAKPIMVSFGTSNRPIVPRQPKVFQTQQQRTIAPRSPAPVIEDREDIPNPYEYKTLIPHQYRNKLYSIKPPADLVLGTPLDQKYTPGLQNKVLQSGHLNLGVDYTGPHIFDQQDYEIYESKTLRPYSKYTKPHYYQHKRINEEYNSKYVPQIGIIYSSGVRYYIPQFIYQPFQEKSNAESNAIEENLINDKEDIK